MNKFLTFTVAVLLNLAPVAHGGSIEKLHDVIHNELNTRCMNRNQTAVRVVDLSSGQVLFDHNGGKPLVPASVMKLVTTASALSYLGPAYRFETQFLYTGTFVDGVISGDLIIKGKGDPKLTPEALWVISEELRRLGVAHVKGGLIIDDTFFDNHNAPPSWNHKRSQRAYDARIGALSVNFNTVAFHIYPGAKAGDPLRVKVAPENENIVIKNYGVTKASGRNKVGVRKVNSKKGMKFIVTGKLKLLSKKKVIYVNINIPWKYAGDAFHSFFKRAGVTIDKKTKQGKADESAVLLFTHKSPPLGKILRDLNRYSSNFIAEQIIKTVSAEIDGPPGSHRSGLALSKKLLVEEGVNIDGSMLVDASGKSHKNRLTARLVTDLLLAMNRRFEVGPDFIASLGIMGVDGSVKKRMAKSPAITKARAKTGTLSGVSALAGYVAGVNGKLFAYTIIQNKNRCYYKTADEIEDKIVTAIHLFGEKRRRARKN